VLGGGIQDVDERRVVDRLVKAKLDGVDLFDKGVTHGA